MGEQTNHNTGAASGSTYAPVMPELDPRYPLCYMPVAVHLGIPLWRAKDAGENLRRAKAVIKTLGELNLLPLGKSDGSPLTEDDVTPELIAQHEGQRTDSVYSPEAFDDHLLDVIAFHTGKPRVSYVHIRKTTPRVGYPVDIYQEVGDKEGEERRRVEVYLDGRHLWVADNYEGTGEVEKDDTRFPGLDILNRSGQSARMIEEEDFERLWRRATAEVCRWPEGIKDDEVVHCGRHRDQDKAWCVQHEEFSRLMFPRLFDTV